VDYVLGLKNVTENGLSQRKEGEEAVWEFEHILLWKIIIF